MFKFRYVIDGNLRDSNTSKGLPKWCRGKESACQGGRQRRHEFIAWVGKVPWSRKWQPTPVFLPGKFYGQRSLVGSSPGDHKELDMTEELSAYITSIKTSSQVNLSRY